MWSPLAITGQDTLTLLLSFALRCILYSRISSSSRAYSNYWSVVNILLLSSKAGHWVLWIVLFHGKLMDMIL